MSFLHSRIGVLGWGVFADLIEAAGSIPAISSKFLLSYFVAATLAYESDSEDSLIHQQRVMLHYLEFWSLWITMPFVEQRTRPTPEADQDYRVAFQYSLHSNVVVELLIPNARRSPVRSPIQMTVSFALSVQWILIGQIQLRHASHCWISVSGSE